ncbi:MAG: J domain-containing protein [Longimicrobiales bacterium]
MENRRHYYRILRVQPDAPLEVIKSSYRTLMTKLRLHPDLGGNHADAILINEAYEVLTDPARRAAYDRELLTRFTMNDLSGLRGTDDEVCYSAPEVPRSCPFCKAPRAPELRVEADTRCQQCASPLYPADRLEDASTDQRSLPRVQRAEQIEVFTCWPQQAIPGHAKDLSPAGIQFVIGCELSREQIIKIDGNYFSAIARVASCRGLAGSPQARYAIGAAFVTRLFDSAQGTFVSTSV